jgi:hypothetical protein
MMNFTLTPSEQTARALRNSFHELSYDIPLRSLHVLSTWYRGKEKLNSLDHFLLWAAIAEVWGVPFLSLFVETADSAIEVRHD